MFIRCESKAYQLGVDHRDLTYRHGGRDFRLTDVHGNVLHDVLT